MLQVSKARSPAWGFNPEKKQPDLLRAWNQFIQTGKIETSVVPSHVAESWVRSRYYQVNPYQILPISYLPKDQYEQRLQDNKQLVQLARVILENVFESFGSARYVVALYDKDGYHLIRLAQPEDLQLREKYGVRVGLCFEEKSIGTSGFAIAKRLKKAIRVVGCEKYLSLLHNTAGVYSPILDPMSKEVVGVIAVSGADIIEYPQAESIVVAASTAIENLIKLDQAKRELLIYSKSLQMAIDFLEDAVIFVDNHGCIYEMNLAARQALELGREGNDASNIFGLPHLAPLKEMVADFLQFPDQEERQTELQIRSQTYLVKVKGFRREGDDLLGVLVQMKNIRNLSRIFQNMTGDQPKHTLGSFVGSSKAIQEIKGLVHLAAQSDIPVIIEGESGTGKEVVAQAIHNAGARRGKPFVTVNCAAIPFELLESTIFGHERGAFTGAVNTHIGKFELADGGTLFLDEIAEMPVGMQAKMLRSIEGRTIERVGGKKSFPVNVRILAASNKNLLDQVKKQLFREDLFFRLNVFRIILPPLRERKEDIPDLAHIFIEEFSPVLRRRVQATSPECMDLLSKYDWPGNIRELRNAVQYSMVRMKGNILSPDCFDGFFCQTFGEKNADSPTPVSEKTLSEIQRKIILETLKSNRNNKSKTAQALGIGRGTLYRKLK